MASGGGRLQGMARNPPVALSALYFLNLRGDVILVVVIIFDLDAAVVERGFGQADTRLLQVLGREVGEVMEDDAFELIDLVLDLVELQVLQRSRARARPCRSGPAAYRGPARRTQGPASSSPLLCNRRRCKRSRCRNWLRPWPLTPRGASERRGRRRNRCRKPFAARRERASSCATAVSII